MYHNSTILWKDLIRTGQSEDGVAWDWTSLGVGQQQNASCHARLVAKSDGIWAAEDLWNSVGEWSKTLQSRCYLRNGQAFVKGDLLVELTGNAYEVLIFERPMINLSAFACGIATSTALLVKKVKAVCPQNTPRVTLTRKTLPGYRDLSVHSVIIGGGHPHRVSLSGGILIKENHIAAAGGIEKAIQGVRSVAPHGLKIEIEVRSMEELRVALNSQVDGVLLDNFTPAQVSLALQELKQVLPKTLGKVFLEVSGGLNISNIADYALEGVDILSVGSLTHSVQSSDLSLLVDG